MIYILLLSFNFNYVIQMQADVMDLKTPASSELEGTVIESRVDKRLGTVVSVLVQHGNVKIGDIVLIGPSWGRVRRLISDQGVDLTTAGPSTPVQVILDVGIYNMVSCYLTFKIYWVNVLLIFTKMEDNWVHWSSKCRGQVGHSK